MNQDQHYDTNQHSYKVNLDYMHHDEDVLLTIFTQLNRTLISKEDNFYM